MKFLLVDDNELNLELQKLMLEGMGLTVMTAENGADAIALAERNRFAMIFMDIQMAGMDGFETAEAIRQFDESVPIIALSADSYDNKHEGFRKSGMNASLQKPLKPDSLQNVLHRFLHMSFSRHESPQVHDMVFSYPELLATLGDEQAVLHILQQFFASHERDCALMADHIRKGDFLAARKILHNIIGISGNLCCHQLYHAARTLQTELRQEHADSLPHFQSVWKTTCTSLLNALRVRTDASHVPKSMLSPKWEDLWARFLRLCYDFDIAANDIFLEYQQSFAEHLEHSAFLTLRDAVSRYDYLTVSEQFAREGS